MQSRTHTCGELRKENAGEKVTIVGWMENVRMVGGNLAFVIMRDFYGTVQVVIETEDMMELIKPVTKESTLKISGIVRERSNVNKNIATGEIEIVPTLLMFDVVDLDNACNEDLRKEIERDGVVLYEAG